MSGQIHVPAGKLPQTDSRALFECGGRSIVLFNVQGVVYAIDDSCPHQGASLWGGRLEGRVIQCCAHGLRFDLASGYLLNSNKLKVVRYPVEVIDGQAFIDITPGEAAP